MSKIELHDLTKSYDGKVNILEKINLDVIHSHNLEAAEEFRKEVLTTFPNIGEINIFPLSLSVSCHIGPGSLALTCSKVHPEIW